MKDQPLVTVLVPTIGRRDFFEDTVRSVRDQIFQDFEVIVLDNASPMEAHKAFEEWARSDARIRIVRVEPRVPMFRNFNRGIAEARGKYIAFFHDDDVYAASFLASAVDALEIHPTAAFFGSNYDFIDERGETSERRRWIRRTGMVRGAKYIGGLLRRGRNTVSMPGLVFRRDAIQSGFDETLPIHFGDFVLLMRIAEHGDVFLSVDSVVSVRRHNGQASQLMPNSTAIPLRTQVMLAYCDEYLARHPNDSLFVARSTRRIQVLHRVGLLWGWLIANSAAEAAACAGAINGGGDRILGALLQMADRPLVRKVLKAKSWRAIGKRIGTRLGV